MAVKLPGAEEGKNSFLIFPYYLDRMMQVRKRKVFHLRKTRFTPSENPYKKTLPICRAIVGKYPFAGFPV
ncbi:MAG: hypothetical protein P4L51_06230 [Puia sp.]|nr:hypothetical protein [Puia sp.]